MSEDEINKELLSKSVLEAKARLYDKLTSGEFIPEQNENSPFLVDFEQKAVNTIQERKETKTIDISNEIEKAVEAKETEMVEYKDALGRTRLCQKKDLHKYIKMDKKLTNVEVKDNDQETDEKTLLSDDMRREMDRENWENEAMEEIDLGPVYYESLREGENRELGVGYYKLSKDEEQRKEQLTMLNKLRDETKKEQVEARRTKDKNRSKLEARLEKIRQRKILKLKEQGKEIPKDLLLPIQLDTPKQPKKLTPEEIEEQERVLIADANDDLIRKFKVREWDKVKEQSTLWAPAEHKPPKGWQDPHDERLEEFAPPSSYYAESKKGKYSSKEFIYRDGDIIKDDISYRTDRIIHEVKNEQSTSKDYSQNFDENYNSDDYNSDDEYKYKPVQPFSMKGKHKK